MIHDQTDDTARAPGDGRVRDSDANQLPLAPRAILAAYGATLLITGLWAAGFPRSFYDDFPGFGRVWVSIDGPYNEHLVRDVGALYLALAALLVVAAVRGTPTLVAVAAGVNLVNALPHLAYHAANLDVYDTVDQIANVIVLGVAVAAPIGLLLYVTRRRSD
jgi:hypothetical protein